MKVRFQADADLRQQIILAVKRREPDIDFRSAVEAGLAGLPDEQVLARSAADSRVLVSHDLRTMPVQFGRFIESNRSAGVLLVPQRRPIPDVADALVGIWLTTDLDEWADRLLYMPGGTSGIA